jgi:hypothetical protein
VANPSAYQNRPVLNKDAETKEWVLKVDSAVPVRIPLEQRGLARKMFVAATWAYHNGRRDVQREIKAALGVEP